MLRLFVSSLLAVVPITTGPTVLPASSDSATTPSPCMELSAETMFLCVDLTYNNGGGSIPRHESIILHWGDGIDTWVDMARGTYPHTYATPGDYTITMEPLSGCGAGSWLSIPVEVQAAPELPLYAVPQAGLQIRVLTTEVLDTEKELRSTVDWGDGTAIEAFDWTSCATTALCTPIHDYDAPGEYTVRVRVEYIGATEQPCYEREATVVAVVGITTPVHAATWGAIKALYQ